MKTLKLLFAFLLLASAAFAGNVSSLPVTASSPNSDDYLAIDGDTANKTRRILATYFAPAAATTSAISAAQAAAIAASQPLDSDLTAIAALATTSTGRNLLLTNTLTAAGLSLTNGANIDAWGAKTIYAGNVAVTTAKTFTVSNTLTLTGTDGSTLNVGTGGTLGSNAFNSTSYQPLATHLTNFAALADGTGWLHNDGAGNFAYTTPSGGGDFSSNTSTSVDSEVVLFSGTAGKTGKRATGSGIAKLTSGVLGTATAGTDYLTPTGSAAGLTGFPTLNQNTTGTAANLSGTPALPNGTTATTQTVGDNTTKLATTAFVIANAGSGTGANPSATIGLTANNGVATTFMRSDASPALGVGIAPHWTAQHWFDLNPRITDNTAPTTGTSALALGTNYTLNGLTANYSFTSLSGTSGRSKVHLVGCDGTHTFTWTTAAQRAGDAVGTTTTITPTAGDHTFVFYYDTVTSAYYYTDDQTGPLNLAGGATAVTGNLPAANVASGALASGMTATTQTAADNSTKVATTAYTDAAVKATAASVNLGNCTGTINIDWSAVPNGGMFRGVLTGNTTFTFSNGADGKTIIVDVAQTGTNTFTVAWPSMKWPAGTAPTMTTGAATSDITTIVDVNATFKGSSVQNVK